MRLLNVAILAMLCCALTQAGDEWPDFRGPDGQGHSAATGLPSTWSESQNVVWKTPIPGTGWSSPVIYGDEVWLTTAVPSDKPDEGTTPSKDDYRPAKPGSGTIVSPKPLSLRALCVSLQSGKIIKNIEVFFIEKPGNIHARNSYASPSPVLEKDRLYVHFGTYGTACVSTAEPKVLWRNTSMKLDHQNGPGGSPVLYKDKILLCCDGMDFQYMTALKKETGETAWKTDRSVPVKKAEDMRKAYGTPFIANIDGKDQAIANAADCLYSYDPDTGKELWHLKYVGFSNVARPVYDGKLLYISTGFMNPELWAIKPVGSGELDPEKVVVWREKVQASRQTSPVLSGNRIYMFSDSGIVRCLESATKKELWREKIAADAAASPIVADGKVFFFDAREGATVVADSEVYKLIAKNTLDDGFMASPAVTGKSLVLRTKQSLYRIEAK